MEINTAAPVVTRDKILIHAPIETIWGIQTNIDAWPSWQPDVSRAQADAQLTVGLEFHWATAGLDITSIVHEIDAPRRIVWGGSAQGIDAVHVWSLEPKEGGVLVRTEESWEGEPVSAQVEAMQRALDGSLHNWLENLKRAAEDSAEKARP